MQPKQYAKSEYLDCTRLPFTSFKSNVIQWKKSSNRFKLLSAYKMLHNMLIHWYFFYMLCLNQKCYKHVYSYQF